MRLKPSVKRFVFFSLVLLSAYGINRLYFHLTEGFTLSNITFYSAFPTAFQPQWEVRPLLSDEQIELKKAINQPYFYLGKGFQSYVFASQDGHYVIKFFKYKGYRLPPWLNCLPLPAIKKYREEKLKKKWLIFDSFVKSWKMTFENLKEETGLIFVHLNKTQHLQQKLTLYDKIGLSYQIDLDQMEFCIQHKAKLLCEVLLDYKVQHKEHDARQLIHDLIQLIASECARGFTDTDSLLMQNTGVFQGKLIHIDIGKFVFNEAVKQAGILHQELFTRTYRLKRWLNEHYPEIGDYLDTELSRIIGDTYATMQPQCREN